MCVAFSFLIAGVLCLCVTQSAANFDLSNKVSHKLHDNYFALRTDKSQDPGGAGEWDKHDADKSKEPNPTKVVERGANSASGTLADQGDGKPKIKTDAKRTKSAEETKYEKYNPFASGEHHPSSTLVCGATDKVGAHSDKYEDCPEGCPYFAQNRADTQHCTFLCVPGDECGRWNAKKPIPDNIKNTKSCRGPMVAFCKVPVLDGSDRCQRCQGGFALYTEDGQCYFQHWTAIISSGIVFAVLFVIIFVWVCDLCFREAVNQDACTKAEAWRSRSKILKRPAPGAPRRTHPIFGTNLCTDFVAGPGMMLHFRFQFFFIVWPLVVALVWVILACFNNELFILGTRKFGTPRHNCILVAWGYETQQRLMWAKVLFLAIVYLGSFVSFLLFSIYQRRSFQLMDVADNTMKDFAVQLDGLPQIPCSFPGVEQDLQKAVEAATGKTLVGVSVCWDYSEHQDSIELACAKELERREKQLQPTAEEAIAEPEMGSVRRWMYNSEKKLFAPGEDNEEDTRELLEQLVSSNVAFAVFNTQKDRNSSCEVRVDGQCLDTADIEFDATPYGFGVVTLSMRRVHNEPANINWHNFSNSENKVLGCLKGFFQVYLPALLIWFFLFYVPYAAALYNFNYDNGAELPGYYSIIFTIIVCGGNATMYVVCDICCDIIGFRYKDSKMVAYMLMYLVACMINVFLDMVVTYWVALKVMVGLGFRTYDGTRLADISSFTEQFETYAMQRSLGENVFAYAWPSTFFLCFVIEPFVTVILPYQIGKLIVRTHPEIQGIHAEAYLLAFELDLGRYADILLNVFLGVLIFFFPGGYIWTLFFAMAFSHLYIYAFDHWKVCDVVPFLKITSPYVDWWAQVMMAGCCALILSCLVFKANCETYSPYCIQGVRLIAGCAAAGVAHFLVHLLLLVYLVPQLERDAKDLETDSYYTLFETVAKEEPRTWFSVNPVHCLRSKYIHMHKKYCRLAYFGKEHLLEKNGAIGCYFEDVEAEAEDYGIRNSMSFKELSR